MLIKVCGLTLQHDVQFVASLGIDFAGFIFSPKSKRCVDPAWVAGLDTGPMKRVGVFVEHDAAAICRIMDEAHLDYAQLHGDYSVADAQTIGKDRVIRVLWPERFCHKAQLYQSVMDFASSCAYYLVDAGLKGGGSGKTCDWEELSGFRFPHPWFLAGGLSPKNVVSAILEVKPDGVDFNSGVETGPGEKNHQKLREAVSVLESRGFVHEGSANFC